jgi:hypothetical protein
MPTTTNAAVLRELANDDSPENGEMANTNQWRLYGISTDLGPRYCWFYESEDGHWHVAVHACPDDLVTADQAGMWARQASHFPTEEQVTDCHRRTGNINSACGYCGWIPIISIDRRYFGSRVPPPDFETLGIKIPDSYVGTPRKLLIPNIRSFGVELEGYIASNKYPQLQGFVQSSPRGSYGYDGSIRPPSGTTEFEARFWTNDLDEMAWWLDACYKIGAKTNSSCGFHIHVKPVPEKIYAFATKHYWDEFYTRYREFAKGKPRKYLERLNNHYCAWKEWSVDALRSHDRYSAINLYSLIENNAETIEHRLLPHQEDAKEADTSVRWLINTASELIAPEDLELREIAIEGNATLKPVCRSKALGITRKRVGAL